jgi:predicted metal-dependent peptidase
MIFNKNIHEKIVDGVQTMLIDTKVNLPYYGEFNLQVNFTERDSIGTCAVNVTSRGMNFFYSPKFLQDMSQKEVNFIILHEDFHLLFDHPKRTVTGNFDHKLSNIVQDMIINHIIWDDISHSFVEIPKSSDGKNMALFVPKEYDGELIFEHLYEWMQDEKDKWLKEKQESECKSCGGSGKKDEDGGESGDGDKSEEEGKDGDPQSGDGEGKSESDDCPDCEGSGNSNGEGKDSKGKPSYGPYGKNSSSGSTVDTWSKEQIFQDMENGDGEYLDKHIEDEVPQEMREGMVKDVMDRLAARGLSGGDIEQTLGKLRKKRKDYLREIKRSISNVIFGTNKQKTITRANRRGIKGLKGHKKVSSKINCILDTSGSMGGTFEKVLSFIYRNDIEVNLIEADTEVKWVKNIKSKKALETICIKGLGGTMLQPAIDYVVNEFNQYNTVVLTDGYCDSLDLSKIRGRILMISVGVEVPITSSNSKVKQIIIDPNHD